MDSQSNNQQEMKAEEKDKPICLKENKEFGRYYEAGRDLKAGEVILMETPVSYAPTTKIESAFAMDKICCFGCNRILNGGHSQQCSKCKLFVCSSACEKMAVHADNECKIFQNLKAAIYNPTLKDIFYLRTALVKKSKPNEFERIKNLACGFPKEGNDLKMDNDTVKILLDCFGLEELLTVDEWIQIANVVNANYKSSATSVKPVNGEKYDAAWGYLGRKTSLFAHSCAPNCFLECTPLPKMVVSIRTCTDIKKGEVVSIDYFGSINMLLDTEGRQNSNKFFVCKCRRCMDPSELGSHLATVVCPECKAMDMMTTNPMVKTAAWKCNSCEAVGHGGRNTALKDDMSYELLNFDPAKLGIIAASERIKKLAGNILHPNHWLLAQALLKITNFLDGKADSMDSEQFSLYVSSMEQLISITSIVNPGYSDENSKFQYTLASALLTNVMKKKDELESESAIKSFLKTIARAKKLLTDSGKFLEYYVGTCHSHKCDTAEDIRKKLQGIKDMRAKMKEPPKETPKEFPKPNFDQIFSQPSGSFPPVISSAPGPGGVPQNYEEIFKRHGVSHVNLDPKMFDPSSGVKPNFDEIFKRSGF